jgi:hypothetical protein
VLFPYAETHFKFNLPWSPLWRPWPEIFVDAPSFCLPGRKCPLFLAIKDAHLFPIDLLSVRLLLTSSELGDNSKTQAGEPQVIDWEPEAVNRRITAPLVFLPLAFDLPDAPGLYHLYAHIRVRNAKGRETEILQANYPFLPPRPLEIRRLAANLPYPVGPQAESLWQAGEMHCHSDYSSDPVEFGAPLAAMQQAGEALGLNFIQVTDHSYDFGYNKDAYMRPVDAAANFAAYQAEVAEVNQQVTPAGCRLIAGEEVSCGNSRGENVHLLVMGPPRYLLGMGDSGRRGLNNRPDLSIEAVLEKLGQVPCFAAHPRVRIGRLERFIFRRGPWDAVDIATPHPALRGLQFWNGSRSTDFIDGRRFWVEALLQGRRYLPIGANDAHGDFNQNVGVKFPLFSLYRGRNHVLGKVRTLFPAPTHGLADLQNAALGSVCTATDGPFLSLLPESTTNGTRLQLTARSTADFGVVNKISVLGGTLGDRQERRLFEVTPASFDFETSLNVAPECTYMRAEAETSHGRFALTSAYFVS